MSKNKNQLKPEKNMKKILMTLSLALAAVIAVPSVMNAQEVATAQTEQKVCTGTECSKDKKECKKGDKDRKDFKKGKKAPKGGEFRYGKVKKDGKGPREMGRGGENPLFNGITLSAEQQQQYQAFQEKQRSERQAARAEKQKQKEAKREARAAEMKAKREAYDQEMKKILTTDQYKQYEANKEKMEQARAGMVKVK